MRAHTRTATTVVLAVATVLGASLGVAPSRRFYREAMLRRELARLVDVAATQSRVRGRLSVSVAPRVKVMRSAAASAKPVQLFAAISAVLERAQLVDGRAALQASAVAHYHAEEFEAAVDELARVAEAEPGAAAWNDVAAARLERSRAYGTTTDVVPALVAVERALSADPRFAPALYNRAAILDRMGLRGLAHAAWQAALVAEPDARWQEDIRVQLNDRGDGDVDAAIVTRTFAGLRIEEPGDVRETVNRFPQEARRQAEGVLPAQWAQAVNAGDAPQAKERLDRARALAAGLRERSGETLAAEAVAILDEATRSGKSEQVAALARAYTRYGAARGVLETHDFGAAEAALTEAATMFARANHPMANIARYNAATAILEQNRVEEAAKLYATLLQEERARPGHRAFAAQLAWHLARAEGIRGHWDTALAAAQQSVDGFRALGEKENTGFMENMLAELYDYLGQPERAWSHRITAFALLSDAQLSDPQSARRLQVALGAAARVPARRKDWPAAIALLDLEIAQSQITTKASQLSDALARRARAKAASGDAPGARRDVDSARTAALRIADPQERALIDAAIDVATALAQRDSDPKNSVRLLTHAIEFHERAKRSIALPELHLERGRSYLALGAETQALADFSSGIDRLEEQRTTLSDFDLRGTIGDVGGDLYVEAVRAAVHRGDVETAYRFSERSRGRTLIGKLAASDVAAPTSMPDGTRLIEFMILPEKVIGFSVDRELRMTELPIGQAELQRLVDSFSSSILRDSPLADVQAAGASLYDTLLRPLGPMPARLSTLVFVSGGALERVPWAAAYDRERKQYLAEEVSILAPPSATIYGLLSAQGARPMQSAVIVGNPTIGAGFVDLPSLRGAEQEARAIAEWYRDPVLLLGDDATIDRVRRAAGTSTVLHFGGHAVSSELSDDQSFLVLAPEAAIGSSGVLHSRDIAGLDLRHVSVVVLAACGTLRGPTVHIDGVPSIGRSFLAAGAQSVIGTLWDVDDDHSAALFARIHARIAGGAPVAEAVRDVQRDAIRSGDATIAHPRIWAGLMVTGASPHSLR